MISARLQYYCEPPPVGVVTSSEDFFQRLLIALMSHKDFDAALRKQLSTDATKVGEALRRFVKYLGCDQQGVTDELVTDVVQEAYKRKAPNLRDLKGKPGGP